MLKHRSTHLSPQQGVSLIEVLVALVLLGFAAIATIKLQTLQTSSQDEGNVRILAAQLGGSMVQRMYTNLGALTQYQNQVVNAKQTVRTKPTPDCGVVNCTQDQLARFDVWWWDTALRQNMPSVFACIVPSSLNPLDEATVVILWRGRQSMMREVNLTQTEVKSCEALLGNDTRFKDQKRAGNNQAYQRIWQQKVIVN